MFIQSLNMANFLCMIGVIQRKNNSMTRKRDKIWTAIIATKQWFNKLFSSEADALVDDFKNNPPPEIGTQSFTGDIHDKGD